MNTIRILYVTSRWKVLCVVYRDAAAGSDGNEIKILPYSDEAAKYLSEHLEGIVSTSGLTANDIHWVDESKFYENGVEIRIELEDDVVKSIEQFCNKHDVTSEKLFYGLSCFLCNPANEQLVLGWIKEVFKYGPDAFSIRLQI